MTRPTVLMRLLFLSNFYPPARSGGYTQWCYEVATELEERGHTVAVLTSRHEHARRSASEQNIYRLLHLEGNLNYYQPIPFFTRRRKEERENLRFVEETVRDFAPDLLFVWGMWALSKGVPARAEALLPGRVIYYLSDYWPATPDMHSAYWQLPANHILLRAPKRLLGKIALLMLAREGRPALRLDRVICVSGRVRDLLLQAGLPIEHAKIIHGGTAVERFLAGRPPQRPTGELRLLYAGQLAHHKGVHTAIEAMARLSKRSEPDRVSLTLVGSGHPDYETFLRELVERQGLEKCVSFHGPVSREVMPDVLQQFDVLIFPSIYEEPLARMTQEAMAAGLVVIGTTTGGTTEILRENESGLTFVPEDAEALARQIERLISEPDLRTHLAQAGRQIVMEKFTLDRMVRQIESYLLDSLAHRSEPGLGTPGEPTGGPK